jgi:hypothetical protein
VIFTIGTSVAHQRDQVGDRGLAGAAVAPDPAGGRQLARRAQAALARHGQHLLTREPPAGAEVGRLGGPLPHLGLHQLGHQRAAAAAAGAGAGAGVHLAGRAQAAAADRGHDRALGDGVAGADGGLVGQVAGERAAGVGQRRQRIVQLDAARHHRLQRLCAARVAHQDRPHRPPVADHQAPVDAPIRIRDGAAALGARVADRHQVDAHHLQGGARHRAGVGLAGAARDRRRRRPRLLVDRRHQPVDHAAVLDALADRPDRRIAGAQPVVDHDRPLALQPRRAGELDVRPDPHRDHQQVAVELGAVGEAQAGHPAVAEHLAGVARQQHLDVQLGHAAGEQGRRRRVELALHEAIHQVHHCHRHALRDQTARGLQPQQPAAEHAGAPHAPAGGEDLFAVLRGAEDVDAGLLDARDRGHQRRRAGGERERRVGQPLARGGRHDPRRAVDRRDRGAGAQRDAVILVPGVGTQPQLLGIARLGQQVGQAHAVVGRAPLRRQDRDRQLRAQLAGTLGERLARDAAADDHQPRSGVAIGHAASRLGWRIALKRHWEKNSPAGW